MIPCARSSYRGRLVRSSNGNRNRGKQVRTRELKDPPVGTGHFEKRHQLGNWFGSRLPVSRPRPGTWSTRTWRPRVCRAPVLAPLHRGQHSHHGAAHPDLSNALPTGQKKRAEMKCMCSEVTCCFSASASASFLLLQHPDLDVFLHPSARVAVSVSRADVSCAF